MTGYEYRCTRCDVEWSGEYPPDCDRAVGRSCIAIPGRNTMDPNENLKQQLQMAKDILDGVHFDQEGELAELVLALDEWIMGGGFLPTDWNRPR